MYLGEGLSANSIRTTTQKYDLKKIYLNQGQNDQFFWYYFFLLINMDNIWIC